MPVSKLEMLQFCTVVLRLSEYRPYVPEAFVPLMTAPVQSTSAWDEVPLTYMPLKVLEVDMELLIALMRSAEPMRFMPLVVMIELYMPLSVAPLKYTEPEMLELFIMVLDATTR
ncbi:Uncharacterised protein [Candidatus Anstonella stagnisolia]|nr:Uncharacterised protein [Candidatus Anstonella stagnisolia]